MSVFVLSFDRKTFNFKGLEICHLNVFLSEFHNSLDFMKHAMRKYVLV